MPAAEKDYEPGAAMRALADLQVDGPEDRGGGGGRLQRMQQYLEDDERTLAEEKAAADAASSEVAELQAQLAAMESESRRLQAILEVVGLSQTLCRASLSQP